MQERPFGSAGVQVPVLGLGTWNIEKGDVESAIVAIRTGIDEGLTHIDTAELYGKGKVESIVATALEGRRDKVFLAGKVHPENATYDGTLLACERSLKRLKTDRLDLYLLHWVGPHPFSETLRAFERLRTQGKILAYGVSNFDVPRLEAAVLISEKLAGKNRIVCNQVLYHLNERMIEHEVIPFCEKHKIAVVGYSPFAQGNFPGPRSSRGKVLGEIAEDHNATPRQVALNFLTRRPSLFSIPKASNSQHVSENAKALRFQLTKAEISALEKTFPRGPKRAGVPTL